MNTIELLRRLAASFVELRSAGTRFVDAGVGRVPSANLILDLPVVKVNVDVVHAVFLQLFCANLQARILIGGCR
jgi:hypothetical protein